MEKFLKRGIAVASVVAALCAATSVFAYVSPGNPSGYVNDFAGVMSDSAKISLENELKAFNASTSNEIAVVTVKSLGGDYIENYAVKLFAEWGIGKKDKDNGALLVVAIQDKTLRIEVGYGLEGALPDSVASSIITGIIIPLLKEQKYDEAITEGVHAILKATEGEYQGAGATTSGISTDTLFGFGIFGLVILQWFAAILARSKSYWAGGVIGLLGGIIASSFFGWWMWIGLALTVVLGVVGLLLDFAVSTAYAGAKSAGASIPWYAGGSSGSSGGGGGFGGFGGGSSGGGGASGSW